MTRKINPKSLENLKKRKSFVKNDPRINRLGRASNFDQLRKFFQEMANEEIEDGNTKKTRLRKIGEELSRDKKLMKDYLEFAYGKVPLSQIIKVDEHKEITWKEFINGYGRDSDSDPNNK
jgi:hypothetical protein